MSETQREAAARRLWGGQVPEPDDNPWLEVFFAGWDARSAALPSREELQHAIAHAGYGPGFIAGGIADAVLSLLSGGSGE